MASAKYKQQQKLDIWRLVGRIILFLQSVYAPSPLKHLHRVKALCSSSETFLVTLFVIVPLTKGSDGVLLMNHLSVMILLVRCIRISTEVLIKVSSFGPSWSGKLLFLGRLCHKEDKLTLHYMCICIICFMCLLTLPIKNFK